MNNETAAAATTTPALNLTMEKYKDDVFCVFQRRLLQQLNREDARFERDVTKEIDGLATLLLVVEKTEREKIAAARLASSEAARGATASKLTSTLYNRIDVIGTSLEDLKEKLELYARDTTQFRASLARHALEILATNVLQAVNDLQQTNK